MTNERMTSNVQRHSPSSSMWWVRWQSTTALAVGAVLLTTITSRSQAQNAPVPPAYRWLYGQQAPQVAAAAAAKAAAAQQTISGPETLPIPNATGTFVTFDAPGAVNGTYPVSIDAAGQVTGYFYDANYVGHGFHGFAAALTTFDVPGDVFGTYPSGSDPLRGITGYYCDIFFDCHGFLQAVNGTFTSFDAPGDANGIYPNSIDPQGVITGYYYDENYVGHGFVRTLNGTLTTFDVSGDFYGTFPASINAAGAIAGAYEDVGFAFYGFVQTRSGLATFSPPGSLGFFAPFSFGTGLDINATGAIAGSYFQAITGNPFGGNYQGFLRTPDGNFTTFAAATYSPCCIWTFAYSINENGVIAGSYNDGYTINYGYLRSADGTITALTAPGAGSGFNQGTAALAINANGQTTGIYIDSSNQHHGFVYQPN
jgi:hypothetical protein